MVKRFSSPRPFTQFRVVREADGAVVLEAGPACVQPVSRPGPVGPGLDGRLLRPHRARAVTTWRPPGVRAIPSQVGAEVFDDAVRAVQRAFYFQRAFTAIEAAHAEGPWVHPSDAALAPPGVRGGWHDAGDYSLYSASLNSALFWLLLTAADFAPDADDRNIPESETGFRTCSTRRGRAWSGCSRPRSAAVDSGTPPARSTTGATARTSRTDPPYRAGEVGTLATARAVGKPGHRRHAVSSVATRRFPAARWTRPGGTALPRWNPGTTDGPTCPAYRADGNEALGREARTFAAAGMLLGTGEARFVQDFERFFSGEDKDPSYMRVQGLAVRLYLRAPAGIGGAQGRTPRAPRPGRRAHPGRRGPRRLPAQRAHLLGLARGGVRPGRLLRHSPLSRGARRPPPTARRRWPTSTISSGGTCSTSPT